MTRTALLRHLAKHNGTGRACSLVEGAVADLEPPELGGERYVLLVAAGEMDQAPEVSLARRWIESGASYVCSWGVQASEIEETFDYATFLPEVGPQLDWTLMTTEHSRESIEEALWFAFYTAFSPDDIKTELNRVVIAASTPQLVKACEHWVQTNAE